MDAFVVINSVAGLIKEGLLAISVLRLFRVLKMIRLFRGLTQLRIMIDALYSAIVPVDFGRSPTTSFRASVCMSFNWHDPDMCM